MCERLRKTVIKSAAEWTKLVKGPKPPKPCQSYKPLLLGSESLDSRGHLPLETFLRLALQAAAEQRQRNAHLLDAIWQGWMHPGTERSFDAFACVERSSQRAHGRSACLARGYSFAYVEAAAARALAGAHTASHTTPVWMSCDAVHRLALAACACMVHAVFAGGGRVHFLLSQACAVCGRSFASLYASQ